MKASPSKRHPSGYVSLLVVISTGTLLTLLTIHAYKRAAAAHSVQSKSQLRVDYAEKEEAILRSIVAITPNRAIRAMQGGSAVNAASKAPMSWQRIFSDALDMANSRTSISNSLRTTIGIADLRVGNAGDSALGSTDQIFRSVVPEEGYVSAGVNRSLGAGYPASLTCDVTTTSTNDFVYPIISDYKYPSVTVNSGPQFNNRSKFGLIPYPKINFGYAKPGEDFVAKRNWWAFSMNVAGNDASLTKVATTNREYVLSIYEIPSQLAISAASFMSLGTYESGDAWNEDNVKIDGNMFVGRAEVSGGGADSTKYDALASRRSMTLGEGTLINDENFGDDPFAAGFREFYQTDKTKILPVSLASESGRAAFIPISRGRETDGTRDVYPFLDRFAAPLEGAENNVLSSTKWNQYSRGSMQCAMRLTVTNVKSSTNQTPTMLELEYYPPTGDRVTMKLPQDETILTNLPAGFVKIANEGQTHDFKTQIVDVAYGIPSTIPGKGFTFRPGLSGNVFFDNSVFGDPYVGVVKEGYWRPRAPFGLKNLTVSSNPTDPAQTCIAVYPERMRKFLQTVGGAGSERNHSLVVNLDYLNQRADPYPNPPARPRIPCVDSDIGVVLQECADLTGFTQGFSLVTNLRLYFGGDFNTSPTTAPNGYIPAVTKTNTTGRFLPPCSLFAPEKRYGADVNPFGISISGQIGSLASVDKVNSSDADPTMVRPLESKNMNGVSINSANIEVNLSRMRDPSELPPITMMNWLVLLEERRGDLY